MIYNIRSVYWITKCYPDICEIVHESFKSLKKSFELDTSSTRSVLNNIRVFKCNKNDTQSEDIIFFKNYYIQNKIFPKFKNFLKYRIDKLYN